MGNAPKSLGSPMNIASLGLETFPYNTISRETIIAADIADEDYGCRKRHLQCRCCEVIRNKRGKKVVSLLEYTILT